LAGNSKNAKISLDRRDRFSAENIVFVKIEIDEKKFHYSMASMVQMSRSCMRVLRAEQARHCQSRYCLFRTAVFAQFDQLKISFYQVFLWLWWSKIGKISRKAIGFC
jgi:hypothetical protein